MAIKIKDVTVIDDNRKGYFDTISVGSPTSEGTTIEVNSTSPAVKIIQKGAGNALVVEDSLNDITPFIIDSAGNVQIYGNLVVNGTTATVNATNIALDDPILLLGGENAPTVNDGKDRGVLYRWHNGTVARLGFFGLDRSGGNLVFFADAVNTNEVISGTQGTIEALTFKSTVATGAPPLAVASTTKVSNLNADSVDGIDFSTPTQWGVTYATSANNLASTSSGTSDQLLRSTGSGAPSWTIARYPYTIARNQLLYAVEDNSIAGMFALGNAILVTNSSGVPSLSTTLPPHSVSTSLTVPMVVGSSGPSGRLQLRSTSSATKGDIVLGVGGDTIRLGNTASFGAVVTDDAEGRIVVTTGASNQFLIANGNSTAPSFQTRSPIINFTGDVSGSVTLTNLYGTFAVGIKIIDGVILNSAAAKINSLGVGSRITIPTENGEIRASGSITAFYSDARLKENTQVISDPINKIEALTGLTYQPNDLAVSLGYKRESQVGLLAQDVQKVLPEAVKIAPFDADENGNSKSGENYLTVQYEKLIPLLVEAIKALNKEVQELKGAK